MLVDGWEIKGTITEKNSGLRSLQDGNIIVDRKKKMNEEFVIELWCSGQLGEGRTTHN